LGIEIELQLVPAGTQVVYLIAVLQGIFFSIFVPRGSEDQLFDFRVVDVTYYLDVREEGFDVFLLLLLVLGQGKFFCKTEDETNG